MKLASERKRRRWSQAELARRAHMNPSTVSLIEAGRLVPYPSQLRKLAKALRIRQADANWLLVDDTDHEESAFIVPGENSK